jgi:hypothetical protein
MDSRSLLGACLAPSLALAPVLQASAVPPHTSVNSSQEFTRHPSTNIAPGCKVPLRKAERYVRGWRFLTGSPGEVRGTFGRLSWSRSGYEFQVEAGVAVDVCMGFRGGGMEYTEFHAFVGPDDGRRDIGRVNMVGFGVLASVPSAVDSGL